MNETPTDPHDAPAPPPQPQPQPAQPHSGMDAFFDSIRRSGLARSDERWIGGVGGGVAARLGIDPLVVRGVLAVSVLLGGLGLVLYSLGWLLLPERSDGRIHLQQLFRGDFDVAVLGGFALFLVGLSFPDQLPPFLWWSGDSGWWRSLLWLGVLALVAVWLFSSAGRRRATRRNGAPTPPYAPGTGPTGAPTTGPDGPTTTLRPGEGLRAAPTYPLRPTVTPTYPAAGGSYPAATSPVPTSPYPPYSSEGPHMYPPATGTAPTVPTGQAPGTTYPAAPTGTPNPAWAHGAAAPAPAPGYGWAPAPSTGAPVATLPRTRPRGPGAGVVGVVVALTLMTLAGLLYAERAGTFDGPVALTTTAVAVLLLGLAIIVSGLRGRTSGGLGGLAVLGLVVALPLATLSNEGWDGTWGTGTAVGDVSHTPSTVTEAENGYSLGVGNAQIDLTQLPLSGDTIDVPIHLGAGDLTVVVPADGAFTADIIVTAGDVSWLGDTVSSGIHDSSEPATYESAAVQDGATPDLALTINVGAGTVTVVEEGR
ncbi:MAG: PspC domain-containing protein [Cellulomonadaceae bacterium]|nr:PspC domain-containing protein [Cellulomonadaceae bacterium]